MKAYYLLLFLLLLPVAHAYTATIEQATFKIDPETNTSMGNLSITTSENETLTITSISGSDSPVSLTFSAITTIPNGTTAKVNITAHVPITITPNNYTGKVKIATNNGSVELPLTIEVKRKVNWTIENIPLSNQSNQTLKWINFTINTGNETARQIQFKSRANVPLTVARNYSANCGYFNSIDSFVLFPTLNQSYDMLIKIPTSQKEGTYPCNVTFSSEGYNDTIYFLYTVLDQEKPSIISYIPETLEATKEYNFEIKAKDNVGVVQVIGNLTRERIEYIPVTTENGTENQETRSIEFVSFVNFTKSGASDLWTLAFNQTANTGMHYMHLVAMDSFGNTGNISIPFKIDGLNVIEMKERLTLPTSKSPKSDFLILKEGVDVKLKIDQITYNGTWSLAIKHLESGQVWDLTENNKIADISKAGTYHMTFNGNIGCKSMKVDNSCLFFGDIELETIPQHVPVKPFHFRGYVVEYDVPDPFTLQVGQTTWDCQPIDTGEANTTGSKCEVFVPYYIEKEEIDGTPVKEVKKLEEMVNQSVSFAESQKTQKYMAIGGIFLVILMGIGILYFKKTYSPLWYMMSKDYREDFEKQYLEEQQKKRSFIRG